MEEIAQFNQKYPAHTGVAHANQVRERTRVSFVAYLTKRLEGFFKEDTEASGEA
jgi:hypothetical protein